MAGPTFCATFADGTKTRMSIFCANEKLDLARGVRVSQAAYESRKKKRPPAIVEACFETPADRHGTEAIVLKLYTCDELKQAQPRARGDK
jgi:hypothetical protein